MRSHAQVPTALVLVDRIRVYFASRPQPNISLTTYVDLDLNNPARILELSQKPILELGGPGTFDEHGIMPSAIVADGDLIRLYYSGWCRLGGSAPYHNATGLAISRDGGRTFQRLVSGPVLDRSPEEPFSATSPCVVREPKTWHVFYSSGIGWIDVGGKREHVYDIRHGTSADGVHWSRGMKPAIPQADPEEALTRPSILRDGEEYRMWFCHRRSWEFRGGNGGYRIGFARSPDLARWTRDDAEAGLGISAEGWDSEMVGYPCVVKTPSGPVMLYNGNGFGATGFGYAIWENA